MKRGSQKIMLLKLWLKIMIMFRICGWALSNEQSIGLNSLINLTTPLAPILSLHCKGLCLIACQLWELHAFSVNQNKVQFGLTAQANILLPAGHMAYLCALLSSFWWSEVFTRPTPSFSRVSSLTFLENHYLCVCVCVRVCDSWKEERDGRGNDSTLIREDRKLKETKY